VSKTLDEFKQMVRDSLEQQRVTVDSTLHLHCEDCGTGFRPEPRTTQSCPSCESEDVSVVLDGPALINLPSPSRWIN
jgi:Zn finger protein HypA/HybF involved in hydrogenase expression